MNKQSKIVSEVTNNRSTMKFKNSSKPANTKKLGSDSGIASAVLFLKSI
jgi:hypothetical protein